MKHTKGPWIIDLGVSQDGPSIHAGNTGAQLAQVFNKQNANLIAAAPEMLEALLRIEVMLLSNRDAESDFLLSLIQPAIKKARGE